LNVSDAPAEVPRRAVRLLWLTGIGLDVLAVIGLLADIEPERMGSRILGPSWWLPSARSRWSPRSWRAAPLLAHRLGLAAAAGMLFVAWLVLSRPWTSVFTILLGLVLLTTGGIVAWQLYRWRKAASGEPEDGANLP
jgi:hypothetical protein